jgi:thiamine-monophosphate kinase
VATNSAPGPKPGESNAPAARSLAARVPTNRTGLGEFGRIEHYFKPLARSFPGALDLADDAALLSAPPGVDLVVTTDAMVEAVHFLPGSDPGRLARKLLRVNLSDLAAKGAEPYAYTLTLALPAAIDDAWVGAFAAGLAADQAAFGVGLAGGDSVSTHGPIVLGVTMFGRVASGTMLRRAGAQVGDDIWVSGTLGDGALGLHAARGNLPFLSDRDRRVLVDRYDLPTPRLALGRALRGIAHAAMDLSDGLPGDLPHICAASGVGAVVEADRIPLSPAARAAIAVDPALRRIVWSGGDDYELLFTAPESVRAQILQTVKNGPELTRIGKIVAGTGARIVDVDGNGVRDLAGWRHW